MPIPKRQSDGYSDFKRMEQLDPSITSLRGLCDAYRSEMMDTATILVALLAGHTGIYNDAWYGRGHFAGRGIKSALAALIGHERHSSSEHQHDFLESPAAYDAATRYLYERLSVDIRADLIPRMLTDLGAFIDGKHIMFTVGGDTLDSMGYGPRGYQLGRKYNAATNSMVWGKGRQLFGGVFVDIEAAFEVRPDRPPEPDTLPSFDEIAALEPRLLDILNAANVGTDDPDPDTVWYGSADSVGLKDMMYHVVGWARKRTTPEVDILCTSAAYSVCYAKFYGILFPASE